jgi:enoyl-CoA hydratase/carnithine racemase
MGGGVGLVAAADLVLASRRASFALPETLFGLIPGVIFPYVSERVGTGRARGMALGGNTLFAARAYEWGLVDELCDDLNSACDRLVRRLVRQDPQAQAALKDLVNRYFPQPAGYDSAAVQTFASLLASEGTRTRLSRFASGQTPWSDSP